MVKIKKLISLFKVNNIIPKILVVQFYLASLGCEITRSISP